MLAPQRVTPPEDPAVSLEEAKDHLRVGHDDEDAKIERLIASATDHVEKMLGVALVTQTWRQDFARFGCLRLRPGPVQSIASITYRDQQGDTQTLDPASYRLLTDLEGAYVDHVPGSPWPATDWRADAISVEFVTGVEAEDVSPSIRAAILLIVGNMFETGQSEIVGASVAELPTLERLLFYNRPSVGV